MELASCNKCNARFNQDIFQTPYLVTCPLCDSEFWKEAVANLPPIVANAPIPYPEAEAFLEKVMSGEIKLEVNGLSPKEVYCGAARYKASNSWSVIVFNDCGEFDYIQDIVDEKGRFIDYDHLYWQDENIFFTASCDLKDRKDAGRFHPDEFEPKELAIWHWES